MAAKKLTDEKLIEVGRAIAEHGDVSKAAKALGVSRDTMKDQFKIVRSRFPFWFPPPEGRENWAKGISTNPPKIFKDFEFSELPSVEKPIEEIIAEKRAQFTRQSEAKDARTLIPVRVNIEGAYAVCHLGDPHVDDDGCDWASLQRHIDIINRTPGMFGANVGDLSNNWVGRLARLHSNQSTTAADAVRLVEWLVNSVPWLYLIGGNHDAWSGANDPIKWFSKQAGVVYELHGMRLGLTQANGQTIRINARHDFAGSSMWNGAHALTKAARFAWEKDDIYVCGHRHSAAYSAMVMQNGAHIVHALRVGTFKVFDDYANSKGFPPENLPAGVTVINPDSRTPSGRVTFFWDVEEAAEFLRFLRSPKFRVKAGSSTI